MKACRPRLPNRPGEPEFLAAYNAAVALRVQPPPSVLLEIVQKYQASSDFHDLAPRIRADYAKLIKLIEREFEDLPLSALAERRVRGKFLAWRGQRRKLPPAG